jgi:hypothetical protein
VDRYFEEEKPSLNDLELEHFGRKGMKWGVRRSKSVTGQGRFAGAKTQANDRMIRGRTKFANGPLGKIPGYKKMQKKQINKLERSNERIASGKMKARDILAIYSAVGITDLMFTKTPR